ncbi:MAG TPA: hypothetical protein DIU07_06885 [Rhodobacteraceae bacterium]|nr:hypothetical protein [Paracoccaceae bacterium]
MPTPFPTLADGETLIARFSGNPATYIKEHMMLAAVGAVGATGVLIAMGEPHYWTGAVGALLAIAIRGVYVYSEAVGQTWQLTDKRLLSPTGMAIRLSDIADVRTIISAAQVVTHTGDKYLIKYQPDPKGVAETIKTGRT